MNENKTILVTGGAGAIGSNLVNTIIDNCEKLIILDDFSSGHSDNLEYLNSEKVHIVDGDICTQSVIDEAFSYNINQVYHLAANFANQNSVDNTEKDLRTNGVGIVKVLQASVENKIEKFLTTSSSCVYKPSNNPFIETASIELTTPYAITKMLSEYYTSFYSKFHNLSSVIVRPFNSYGPGDLPGRFRSVVPNFFIKAMNGLPLVITGDGSETRPFTYVQDIVNGLICAMNNSPNVKLKTFGGHPVDEDDSLVYNIGNDTSITILELAEKINEICQNKAGVEFIPRRDWDKFPKRAVQLDKSKNDLNFEIQYDVDTGLKLTYEWFKTQNFKLEG